MVIALLDTAIVVDILRGYPPAVEWLAQQAALGVSTAVWLEVVEGATNRQAERTALHLLHRFERVEVTAEDVDWALRQLMRFHLSHGLDAMDCLIASASHRLAITLFTRNLKHFSPLLGHHAQKPY